MRGKEQPLSLEDVIEQAIAEAFARGEAHGRFMERHEATMRDSLAAIERAEATRAAVSQAHPPANHTEESKP